MAFDPMLGLTPKLISEFADAFDAEIKSVTESREIPLTLSEYNSAGQARRTDFFYVYRVTGREDGMEYAFAHSWHSGRTFASFALAVDAQIWVDHLRGLGNTVNVMPSAEGILK